MKIKQAKFYMLICTVIFLSKALAQNTDYFGQTPPGNTAELFAPGIVSLTNRMESKIVFSPNGLECYFSTYKLQNNNWSYTNYYSRYINNAWTEFKQLSFKENQNLEIAGLSADGKKFYFNLSDAYGDDILMSERSDSGWCNPQVLPAPINSKYTDVWYSETIDSIKYILSNRPGNICDFWRVYQLPDQSFKVENLGLNINASGWHYNPCIAPDESYLIFVKADGTAAKLYLCFNKGGGAWTEPLDMNKSGASINDENQDRPILSPDGKYLFFNRHSGYPYTNKADIFWVSTDIIPGLKKIAYAPKLNKQIPAMNIKTDSFLNYIIPENTFTCEYGTETLEYTATLKNGSALPSWLKFNTSTRTLSGKPMQAETDTITISVTNADTVSATCSFVLTIVPNTLKYQIKGQKIEAFPNPTTGLFTILIDGTKSQPIFTSVFNSLGKPIVSKSFRDANNMIFNLTDYPKGIYIVNLWADGILYNKKICKK